MYQNEEKIKISLDQYFWTFLICSFLGTIYEEILHIICHLYKYHEFDWSRRSGLFFGPLNPVYGFGTVLLVFILGRKKRSKTKVFIGASIIGGVGEFLMSIAQELVTGTTSWDYSKLPLNIFGRTTVPFMLFWGAAGLFLIKWLFPKMRDLLKRIPKKTYTILTTILFILVFIDILISWTALARRELRHKGVEPYTFIGEFYDRHFDDEYVQSRYPNMEEAKE